MDSRSAAHVLSQIGALLRAKGEQRFKARAYQGAARALIALDTDDLGPLLRSGELADTPGIGPATLSVVRDLVETGESRYLTQLSEGMPEGMLDLMPSARVGHIGIYRNPETLQPVEYYMKVPEDIAERRVIVVDPMLATGNSVSAAIQRLKDKGAKDIKLVCLLSAPEGIKHVNADHPDVQIITAAVDRKLNSHGYIVPGLGDAGDRMFGTK